MARRRTGGRVVREQAVEDDPVIRLFIGIVKQAKKDVKTMNVQPYHKITAAQFLDDLKESASRRTP